MTTPSPPDPPIPPYTPQYEEAYLRAPVGRASIRAEGVVARANYALADFFGRALTQIEGAQVEDLHPDLRAALAESTTECELEITTPNGTRWLRVYISPLRTDHHRIVGYDLYATDMTAVRMAEAELRRREQEFYALIENSNDIITVLEVDGSWRFSSASGVRLLGYPRGYDPPGGIFSLLHPDDAEPARRAFEEVLAGKRGPGDAMVLRVRTADGSRYLHFEVVASNLLDDPAVRGVVITGRDVTERVQAEKALDLESARLKALVEHSSDVTTVVEEREGRAVITWSSPSIEPALGYRPDEIIGTDPFSLIHPDDLSQVAAVSAHAMRSGRSEFVECRVLAKDGSYRIFEAITTDLRDEPSIRGFVTNARDITERRAAERQAEQLKQVLEHSIEVVVLSDAKGQLVWANQRAHEFFSLGKHHHVSELSSVESRQKLREVVMPFVRRHGVWTGELVLRTTSGDEVPVIATVQAHRERGQITLVSTIAHDITELKADQRRLEYEATHDPLTALPNRALVQQVGGQMLARAACRGNTIGLLFLDLDRFKPINDTFGHEVGDRVLIVLARRLRLGVRDGDLVARFGGDEFCVLCESVESEDEMLTLGRRICDVVSIPMKIDGREVQLGASIGIALDEGGDESIDTLIRNADLALYRSKRAGGSCVTVFKESSMRGADEGADISA